jgi:TonB family protein
MRASSLRALSALLFASVFLPPSSILAQATTPTQGSTGAAADAMTHSAMIHPIGLQFRDEMMKLKLTNADVGVALTVDAQGVPQNVHVERSGGADMDAKAIEAVKESRYKPAMKKGQPVAEDIKLNLTLQYYPDRQDADAAIAKVQQAGGVHLSAAPQTDAPTIVRPAYADDPKFQKALAQAKEPRLPVDERLSRWKNASKIAKGQCVDCLHQMLVYQIQQSQWKDVVSTATQLDTIATDPKEKFYAEAERGAALMHSNDDEPKPQQLKEAEASMRSALAIAPKNANLLYTEGRALAMIGRDDEATQVFKNYLDLVKMSDPYRTRVEHFLENPRLAAVRMAPAFTLTTSEGEQISLDDMGGKVVLLDFWATWCGPCRESLPDIQKVARKFADQPFVVVSISSDRDENAWKTFVAKNNMTWRQYRDADGALQRAYGVSSIPRFFTIDTDGALQSVKVGSGADIEGDIRKLLKRAADVQKKKARESDHPAAGE